MNNTKPAVINALIFILGAITATAHLLQPDLVLKLNGLGYLALVAVVLLPYPQLNYYRTSALQAFLLYTVVTIVMFFLVQQGDAVGHLIGLMTKGVELALISVLWVATQKGAKAKSIRF